MRLIGCACSSSFALQGSWQRLKRLCSVLFASLKKVI